MSTELYMVLKKKNSDIGCSDGYIKNHWIARLVMWIIWYLNSISIKPLQKKKNLVCFHYRIQREFKDRKYKWTVEIKTSIFSRYYSSLGLVQPVWWVRLWPLAHAKKLLCTSKECGIGIKSLNCLYMNIWNKVIQSTEIPQILKTNQFKSSQSSFH